MSFGEAALWSQFFWPLGANPFISALSISISHHCFTWKISMWNLGVQDISISSSSFRSLISVFKFCKISSQLSPTSLMYYLFHDFKYLELNSNFFFALGWCRKYLSNDQIPQRHIFQLELWRIWKITPLQKFLWQLLQACWGWMILSDTDEDLVKLGSAICWVTFSSLFLPQSKGAVNLLKQLY